jgi:hypothetical protein
MRCNTQRVARKHHFVSEGYLAAFTNTGTSKGLLRVYDHSTQKSFPAKPKDVAFEPNYNRVNAPTLAPDALEKAMGRFESYAVREVRKIITSGKLTPPEEFSYVYNLIALFAVKTPALRRASENAQKQVWRQVMHLTVSSEEMFEQQMSAAREDGFLRPDLNVSYQQMKDFITRDAYTISIPVEQHILTEHSVFDKILPHLSQRYWSVMTAKADAPDIITCDRPAPPLLAAERLVFPLSPRRALLGTKEPEAPEEFEIDTKAVAYLNFKILDQSISQIYSRTNKVVLLNDERATTYDLSRVVSLR